MPTVTHEDYSRAESFLPSNARQLVFRHQVTPRWLDGDRFWYQVATPTGPETVLVDPEAATRTVIDQPPSQSAVAPSELPSPDGRLAAFVRDHNLRLREIATGQERQLTHDGVEDYGYAGQFGLWESWLTDKLTGFVHPPEAAWSPDSRKLVTYRLDQRRAWRVPLVQFAPADGERPRLHTFPYPLPGDEHLEEPELVVLDVETGNATWIDTPPLGPSSSNLREGVAWLPDSQRFTLLVSARGYQAISLLLVDSQTGASRVVLEEQADSWVAPRADGQSDPIIVWVSSDAAEAVWYSHRDNWGHLYLYDAETGQVRRQITNGPWIVRELLWIDEHERQLWFTASGREPGSDPYYRQLYRIGLDGAGLTLLTSKDADHRVTSSPSGRYFLDTYSRIDLPPVTVLRDRDGQVVLTLEEADVSQLLATGWRFPERFSAKAADGETDLYGILIRPTTFEPSQRYPLLDDLYPGPHCTNVPKSFPSPGWDIWESQALAELGFIVLCLDGTGTPYRGRDLHDRQYRNMGAATLDDHAAVIRQLGERYAEIDTERVGIYGISAGGYSSTRAMLTHPETYKVAVSLSGSHDPRLHGFGWIERYMGLMSWPELGEQANARLAANLQGKLLLVTGDMDDSDPTLMTFRMVDALVKANKDFDLLVLPNANHSLLDLSLGAGATHADSPSFRYFTRKRWDYFVRHLLGAEPPAGYEVSAPVAD